MGDFVATEPIIVGAGGEVVGAALPPLDRDQYVTLFVIIAAVVILSGYDVFVGVKKGGGATLSWVTTMLSMRYPTVAFFAGYLCGHLFGSQSLVPDLTKD